MDLQRASYSGHRLSRRHPGRSCTIMLSHKTAAATLALTLLSSASFAAEMPKPCGPDPRERCIAYKPGQIVIMVLAPGQTATIQLPDGEVVYSIGASDNNIIKG